MRADLARLDGPLCEALPADDRRDAALRRAIELGRLPLLADHAPTLVEALAAAARRLEVSLPSGEPGDQAVSLRLAIDDDFALLSETPGHAGLRQSADPLRLTCLAVAMPSHWRPQDKIGLGLHAIHEPVADSAALDRAWPTLARRLVTGDPLRRHVWTITDSAGFSRHPDDLPAGHSGEPESLWFRVERQTLVPLPEQRSCLFLIRVFVAPLADVLAVAADRPRRLREALLSMSESVIA